MNNMGFLFAGYAIAWGAVFVYVWMLSRRAATLQQRLDAVERELAKR